MGWLSSREVCPVVRIRRAEAATFRWTDPLIRPDCSAFCLVRIDHGSVLRKDHTLAAAKQKVTAADSALSFRCQRIASRTQLIVTNCQSLSDLGRTRSFHELAIPENCRHNLNEIVRAAVVFGAGIQSILKIGCSDTKTARRIVIGGGNCLTEHNSAVKLRTSIKLDRNDGADASTSFRRKCLPVCRFAT